MLSPDSTTNGHSSGGVAVPSGNGHHHYHEDDDEPTSMLPTSDGVVHAYHHSHEDEGEGRRKHARDRPRKKKLYAEICKQMEFYFSDANITKNRNMRDIVEKANTDSDGFIDLPVFLEFTKMQRLTSTITHIQKALVRSEKLELSSDQQKARRRVSFDPSKVKSDEAVEDCTIYVENIPRDAEHEWLEKIFQTFGSVAYISLPKSKRGHHKGFAFVEFDDVDAARRCVEVYGEEGACLPNDIDPAKLRSIQSFKEEQEAGAAQNSESTKSATGKKEKKRKASGALDDTDGKPKIKKERYASSSSASDDEEDEKVTTSKCNSSNTLKAAIPLQEEVGTSSSSTKKSKKKRKKNKSKKTIEARLESESIMLKVLPKKSWRQLRNRYLNLQRSNMSKLKKQLKREQIRAHHYKNFYQPPLTPQPEPKPDIRDNDDKNAPSESRTQLDHIMEIRLEKPTDSVDSFKHKIAVELAEQDEDEAVVSGFVKFVDYTPNESIAYVRVNSDINFASRAENLLQKSKEAFASARFLACKEVEKYKERVQTSLKQKLKEQPRKNVRGKDRLMKAATKSNHIKFSSDSEAEDEAQGEDQTDN